MSSEERCWAPSPCAAIGCADRFARQHCTRKENHSGPHRNRFWEWRDGEKEPTKRRKAEGQQ